MSQNNRTLVITEIYRSIQGESSFAGLPCTFIRLTGCPLRCRWCDTVYGFKGGKAMNFEQIVQEVENHGVRLVELTGGEPLAQEGTTELMAMLADKGYQVICETGGSEDITGVPESCTLIMDIKCPDSGMMDRNLWSNLDRLKKQDEIKFVIASRADFDWACQVIKQHQLEERFTCLISAAFGLVKEADLVDWMLESGLKARFNLQQHKYIWSPRAKGV